MNSPESENNEELAVIVSNVTKFFKLPHEKRTSVKSNFVNLFGKQTYEQQLALDKVSFEVKKGEFYGIVGRNGSGKSTMLKLLAGIYVPSNGDIQINGSLIPFIELGVGFNNDLTGRENVYLNGALLGFDRKEMNAMYKDIVEFAELDRFMDQKLKNYSSGMQVRLAFSIAIRAKGDILLLDEVLAVGDSAFQQKCFDYFNTIKKEKKTIILVSHNMQIIDRFCDRALLLEQSRVKHIGDSTTIAGMYEDIFLQEAERRINAEKPNSSNSEASLTGSKVIIHNVKVVQNKKPLRDIKAKIDFEIQVTLESKVDIDNVDVGVNVKNRDKQMLVSVSSFSKMGNISLEKNIKKTVCFDIQNVLAKGVYTVNLGIVDNTDDMSRMLARVENIQSFTVRGNSSKALTDPQIKVTIKNS